jgi:hypothetical protein
MNLASDYIEALDAALQKATRSLIQELEAQGHRNTGRLAASFVVDIRIEGAKIVGEVSGLDYLDYVNRKTTHTRVAGAQVAGLYQWWKSKGLDDKQARSAAFAVAVNQVKYGSPTPGAFRFSNNGKRTGAVEAAFSNVLTDIGNVLSAAVATSISANFTPQLNREIKNS